MTIITGNAAYTVPSPLGQAANNSGATNAPLGDTKNSVKAAASSSAGNGVAATLADAIAAAKNSASLPFSAVGQNARTVLNAGLAAYGQTPGTQTSADQWSQIFGGMDRRSQFAVFSNQGGQFTPQEQQAAKSMMDAQATSVGAVDSSASTSDQLAGYAQKINFLNNVSPEEKQTASWAYSMADSKTAASMIDFDSRMPALDSSSSTPLVNVLMGAMRNVQSQSSTKIDFGTVDNIGQITSQPWAQSSAGLIEAAFTANYRPGGSINLSA